jgi:4-amino-4-deoxy-L-arabinose transferase-like glycosyltransferase
MLRIGVSDTTRDIIPGDETIYWYAAGDLIEHNTFTREIDGAMYRGETRAEPTAKLSPGYPLFIAALRTLGADTSTVLAANIALSLASLLLMLLIMRELGLARWATALAFTLAAVYPGFINNLDRMLTEQLFVALFLGFACAAVRGMRTDRVRWTVAAGVLLALAVHVRAQALPFALVAAVFMYLTLPVARATRHLSLFALAVLVLMAPWWIRNAMTFGHLILLSTASEGAAVWGATPYFIDMGSSRGDLVDVVARNLPPAPDIYYRWRVFGFLQFMWGDVWDERLAHPVHALRKLLLLQPFAVVLPIVAAPLLALRKQPLVLFVACVPIVVTLLAAPFHGLPRYAFPAVPFAFITLAALLSWRALPTVAEGAMATPGPRLDGPWLPGRLAGVLGAAGLQLAGLRSPYRHGAIRIPACPLPRDPDRTSRHAGAGHEDRPAPCPGGEHQRDPARPGGERRRCATGDQAEGPTAGRRRQDRHGGEAQHPWRFPLRLHHRVLDRGKDACDQRKHGLQGPQQRVARRRDGVHRRRRGLPHDRPVHVPLGQDGPGFGGREEVPAATAVTNGQPGAHRCVRIRPWVNRYAAVS